MKIRTGFVSNSSSSSYIVEIKGITLQNFLREIAREYQGWGKFDGSSIERELKSRGELLLSESCRKNPDKWQMDLLKSQQRKLQEDTEKYSKVDDDESFILFALEYHGVSVYEENGSVKIGGVTIMHNDFGDMPEPLKEITLHFLFDTSHTVICKREDHS